MLESTQHAAAWFVTLTYSPAFYPKSGSLIPEDLTKFLKRLRERSGDRIKYFAVGEYGDVSGRCHYHLIIFGLLDASHIAKCWKCGYVHIGFVTPASCNYIASYTVKGMTRADDARLHGRYPEFARMSLRPHGLGYDACRTIASAVNSEAGSIALQASGDVPSQLRFLQEKWPIGRYLRRVVRVFSGMEASQPIEARMLDVEVQRLMADQRVAGKSNQRYSRKGSL